MMDGAAHPRGTGGLLPPQAPSKAKQNKAKQSKERALLAILTRRFPLRGRSRAALRACCWEQQVCRVDVSSSGGRLGAFAEAAGSQWPPTLPCLARFCHKEIYRAISGTLRVKTSW